MHAALPEQAARHVRVADYADGRLLLIVDSGGWATRLHYQQRAIDQALARTHRLNVDAVEIRVRPLPDDSPPATTPRRLRPAARKVLADCARHVEGNPDLAAALQRLARAGRD